MHLPPLPKPPIKSMTDFVVFAFVTIVAAILLTAVLGVFIDGLIRPEVDRSGAVNALADIATTLIGALVGYIAGKGQGHADATKEAHERERERRDGESLR